MNNPFHYIPDRLCKDAFLNLSNAIEALRYSKKDEDIAFLKELDSGKMLGILIAKDRDDNMHTLYAFSGQLGSCGFFRNGFVEPPFDYLHPDGYFKTQEKSISNQKIEIAKLENQLRELQNQLIAAKFKADSEIDQSRKQYLLEKKRRADIRNEKTLSEEQHKALIRESQFQKAELHRLKKKWAATLEPLTSLLSHTRQNLKILKDKRRQDSENLQKWLFDNFTLLNARGKSKSLSDIFADTSLKTPPSGAGECCAPKLLQAAYLRGWTPVSIAEYWYGKSKNGEVRIHGHHYPACHGKCLPILRWMLQGIHINPPLKQEIIPSPITLPQIIFENEWFCVVNKPSGMLSVPGKIPSISLQDWLIEKYGIDKSIRMAHRLDQDTSGLIVATFGPQAYKTMQALFANRLVKKTYIADLDGDYTSLGLPSKGEINLPISPDWFDRPRQRVDFESGKNAITYYSFISSANNRSRVAFHPVTGRTHQLRIHAASHSGLNIPILGDRLYGNPAPDSRLHLHAAKIEFTFPLDGKHYSFNSSPDF